jgi:serine/threonine-protein kinase
MRKSDTGFGSHSGRGTPETSCKFAGSVLDAYWSQFGRPTSEARQVSAPGAVACGTVLTDGQGCDGNNFLMQCQQLPGQSYVTCTGGRNARVYIF